MSVEQLEATIRALPPAERRQFADWFDDHRQDLLGETEDFELSTEQQAEILRRRDAFLADPSLAEPWAGTPEQIHQHLHARRTQKAAASNR
jgi:hypothetical protein